MSPFFQAYWLAVAIGGFIAGAAVGIVVGVRMKHRIEAWKAASWLIIVAVVWLVTLVTTSHPPSG